MSSNTNADRLARLESGIEALPAELRERVRSLGGLQALSLRAWLEIAEAWRILLALEQCRGNRSAAARLLGIGRRTLYSKMAKLGIRSTWRVPQPAPATSRSAPEETLLRAAAGR